MTRSAPFTAKKTLIFCQIKCTLSLSQNEFLAEFQEASWQLERFLLIINDSLNLVSIQKDPPPPPSTLHSIIAWTGQHYCNSHGWDRPGSEPVIIRRIMKTFFIHDFSSNRAGTSSLFFIQYHNYQIFIPATCLSHRKTDIFYRLKFSCRVQQLGLLEFRLSLRKKSFT